MNKGIKEIENKSSMALKNRGATSHNTLQKTCVQNLSGFFVCQEKCLAVPGGESPLMARDYQPYSLSSKVVHILLNPPKKQSSIGFGFDTDYNFDEFANRLKEEFPEDVIKYYWQKAYSNIKNGNRETYRTAAGYLAMVKHIYTEILNEESKWEQRFSALKVEFRKRPAFLDEVRKL